MDLDSELQRLAEEADADLFSIADQLPRRDSLGVQRGYRHHCYDVINQRLDHLASRLSARIQRQGYRSLPVPASLIVDQERLMGLFSNRMAAHLAGLSWIGKRCLLVTPEVGPRVRWATVLTSAPLEPTGTPMEERCGHCEECVRICPHGRGASARNGSSVSPGCRAQRP